MSRKYSFPQRPVVQFDDQIPALILHLYSALNDPQGFHKFLEALSISINGCSAQLSVIKKDPIKLEHVWYSGLSDDVMKWYLNNNMIKRDVVSNHAVKQGLGNFQSAISLLPHSNVDNNYKRWESDQDMLDSAWLVVETSHSTITLLTIQRSVAQGIYHDSELKSLDRLAPYVRQSLQLYRHISDKHQMGKSLELLFEHIVDATFILDDQANILYSNAAARCLVTRERCLRIQHSRFQFLHKNVQHSFTRSSIRVVRASIGKESFSSHAMFIPREEGLPLTLIIKPLKNKDLIAGGAMVTVIDRDLRVLPKANEIAACFELSPSESILCEDLVTGLSLGEIAIKRHKTQSTLRTYLKNIFRKTDSKSQGQLISNILSALLN